MKKLLLMLALVGLAACNDEVKGDLEINGQKFNYATSNTLLKEGHIQNNMFFYGEMEVRTVASGSIYTNNALFELTGANSLGESTLYMHGTRFAEAMPPLQMRIPTLKYTGSDQTVLAATNSVIPENFVPASSSYQPNARYTITDFDSVVEGLKCDVNFVCADAFEVRYTGRLIIEAK